MMFRFMYRLKKKHGAVLFAVIAVMALLIAMSTAAYYTARGSYNTVASSYSYSQLYLSAISSADMISAAIMNEPLSPAAGGNKFDAVQDAVDHHLNPVFQADGTYTVPTDVIYLKSANLSALTFDNSTTTEDVIQALRSVEPVEAGVLDGLTIKIGVLSVGAPQNIQTSTSSESGGVKVETQTFNQRVSYSIETTAYYRGDTITVQDIVTNYKDGSRTVTTPYTLVNIPGNNPTFPPLNPNTTTGQGKPDENGNVGSSGRHVLVSVKRLDGNMSFHNEITYIGTQSNNVGNKIDGSLVSDGSMYFSKCNVKVTGEDNHWYIGKDFVTTNDQAGTIDLGQNNLYVGGDMILGTQQGVKAEEVFVNGDLYVLKQCTIDTKKLHVSGNIYFTEYNADGTLRTEALKNSLDTVSADTGNVNSRLSGNFDLELGGSVIAEGKTQNTWYDWGKQEYVSSWSEIAGGQNVKVGDKYSNIKDGSNYAQIDGASNFDSTAELENGFTVLERDDQQDKYLPVHKDGSLLDAIAQNTNKTIGENNSLSSGEQIVYPNYTAKEETYKNSLQLDFSGMEELQKTNADGTKTTVGYQKSCDVTDANGNILGTAKIIVNGTDMKDVTVNIPYIKDGFVLTYENTDFMGGDISNNAEIKYNIAPDSDTCMNMYPDLFDVGADIEPTTDSGDGTGKTMPIILGANTSGGDFSWKGDDYGSNDGGAYVSVNDDMKVTFEMGNLDTDSNTYQPYDYTKDSQKKLKIPTYQFGTKIAVGSEALIDTMKKEQKFNISKDENNGQMRIGNIVLTDDMIPDNNIMLVSNSTGRAFQADYDQTVVGGYLYSPGGQLSASNNVNGAVINIGSVVISDYEANHADYHVKLPRPSDMDAFIGPMTNGGAGGGGSSGGQTKQYGTPNVSAATYSFGDWDIVGSNYVGG